MTAPSSDSERLAGSDGLADPENAKLVVLARTALTRAYAPHTGAAQGAAVRDTDGRTYAGATVENADATLTTSALRVAVAAAASSGARRFEAGVVLGSESPPGDSTELGADLAVLAEFGAGVPLFVLDATGEPYAQLRT